MEKRKDNSMIIKQLPFKRETIFDYALRDDVYIISIQQGRCTVPRPFGMAFKSVKNLTLPEIIKAMENDELALVEVKFERRGL